MGMDAKKVTMFLPCTLLKHATYCIWKGIKKTAKNALEINVK